MEQRPLSKYTIEDCTNMPHEQFEALLEEDNAWVREHYAQLKENRERKLIFNSIEEVDAYFGSHSLEECINKANKLFGM